MSAMAEMIADIMLKALPDEVRAILTPENLGNVQKRIMAKWGEVESVLISISQAQHATLEGVQLNTSVLASMQEQLNRMETNAAGRGNQPVALPRKRAPRAITNGVGKH